MSKPPSRSAVYDPSGLDVLRFLAAARASGESAALITLVGIDGAAPRAIGEQMAATLAGDYVGSISTGCLEPALVQEAVERLARREGGVTRYGKGSRFIDIVLPCGSGVDILMTVAPDIGEISAAVEALRKRKSCSLDLSPSSARLAPPTMTGWNGDTFTRCYAPPIRIIAGGSGAEIDCLASVVDAAGLQIAIVSSDEKTIADHAHRAFAMRAPGAPRGIDFDEWTAVISFFHGSEWEAPFLRDALNSNAFYVGAVGSPRQQSIRRAGLAEAGLGDEDIARLSGPAGLIRATRDPASLAVSVLAEIIARSPPRK